LIINNFIITDITSSSDFDKLITLLDYRIQISDYLKRIDVRAYKEYVLIDAALISGLGSYRYLKVKIDENFRLDINKIEYDPKFDKNTIDILNNILEVTSSIGENEILEFYKKLILGDINGYKGKTEALEADTWIRG